MWQSQADITWLLASAPTNLMKRPVRSRSGVLWRARGEKPPATLLCNYFIYWQYLLVFKLLIIQNKIHICYYKATSHIQNLCWNWQNSLRTQSIRFVFSELRIFPGNHLILFAFPHILYHYQLFTF